MSAIFPKWTNRLPLLVATGAVLIGGGAVAGMWYYLTPKYSRVGYKPIQPVVFSHATHADQLGLDCRYCHSDVEKSWYSNIPTSSQCMNCHNQVLKDDPRVLADPAPFIGVADLADSSVNIHVRPWVATADYFDTMCDLKEKVKIAFDENGITIPYPQVDMYQHVIQVPATPVAEAGNGA